MKKVLIFLMDSIIGRFIWTIIPSIIFYWGWFEKFKINNMEINATGLALTTIFALIIYASLYLRVKIKKIAIVQKYYNLMLTKYLDRNPSTLYGVYQEDLKFFSKDEIKFLNEFFKEQENLRIIMKGTNKTFGMFK